MLSELAKSLYLDLNDDALIRDIVSGVYSGTPGTHDIQNLYPFSLLVAGLYRILPGIPWFGLILLGLQLLCVLVIFVRALSLAAESGGKQTGLDAVAPKQRMAPKKIFLIVLTALVWCVLQVLAAPHFFFVQYSVTVGFMAACAAFLTVTGSKWRHFGGAVALVCAAYLIRSEMLLLLVPMIFLALLFRYVREVRASRAENEEMPGIRDFLRYPFVTDHYRRYGITLALFFLVIAAGWSLDRIGYAPAEWDDFVRFFDARTQIYDYTGVPSYAEHADFYDSIGLDEASVGLLENYNFGLEEAIDTEAMEAIAAYATGVQETLPGRLGKAIGAYRYRLHHAGFPKDYTWPQTDAPWNLIAWILYLALIIHSFVRAPRSSGRAARICRALWQPLLLFVCRSGLWLFIQVGGRDPVRITHSLYLVEIAVLAGTFLMQMNAARSEVEPESKTAAAADPDGSRKAPGFDRLFVFRAAVLAAVFVLGCAYASNAVSLTAKELSRRESVNAPYRALRKYCAKNMKNLYLFDVYSSVSESRGLFEETDAHRPDNLELMGGWAAKSPAWRDKLDAAGFETLAEALLAEGVYYVTAQDRDTEWLTDYFAARGLKVTVTDVDLVTAGKKSASEGTSFRICEVRAAGEAP